MEDKNPEIDLNKSVILSKFEDLIGNNHISRAKIAQVERTNERLREQIDLLKQRLRSSEKSVERLRNELNLERKQNEAKVDKDEFFNRIGEVLNQLDRKEKNASASWKELLEALVMEVDTCIQIIEQQKKAAT